MSVCLVERVLDNGQVSHVDLVHALGAEENAPGAPVDLIELMMAAADDDGCC